MNKPDYKKLFETMEIHPDKITYIKKVAANIELGKHKYMQVSEVIGCPWQVVGVIHSLECNLNFSKHLHNGDPLTSRTVNYPPNRPLRGEPPFSWTESAIDALIFDEFDKIKDWGIANTLFRLNLYNGFNGYNKRGINSPYLFSFTNHYTKGKYVADGVFDPEAVSKQIGAAPLLKILGDF